MQCNAVECIPPTTDPVCPPIHLNPSAMYSAHEWGCISMHSNIWQCVAMFGNVFNVSQWQWQCLAMCGNVFRPPTDLVCPPIHLNPSAARATLLQLEDTKPASPAFQSLPTCIAMYGNIWQCIPPTSGNVFQCMAMYSIHLPPVRRCCS